MVYLHSRFTLYNQGKIIKIKCRIIILEMVLNMNELKEKTLISSTQLQNMIKFLMVSLKEDKAVTKKDISEYLKKMYDVSEDLNSKLSEE